MTYKGKGYEIYIHVYITSDEELKLLNYVVVEDS